MHFLHPSLFCLSFSSLPFPFALYPLPIFFLLFTKYNTTLLSAYYPFCTICFPTVHTHGRPPCSSYPNPCSHFIASRTFRGQQSPIFVRAGTAASDPDGREAPQNGQSTGRTRAPGLSWRMAKRERGREREGEREERGTCLVKRQEIIQFSERHTNFRTLSPLPKSVALDF